MRAENGAEQNRVMNSIGLLQSNVVIWKLPMVESWTPTLRPNQLALPDITYWCKQVRQ